MAGDKKLLSRIRLAAQSLGAGSAWNKSNRAVVVRDDFLYEMYVLSELLLDLNHTFDVEYVCGSGQKKDCFPRGPAKKAGRPRFNIRDMKAQHVVWQMCAGTKILDKQGNEHGLDISLQTDSSPDNDPNFTHAVLVWECKFKESPNTAVTKPEYETFAGWIKRLDLVSATCPTPFLAQLVELGGNSLVTNGRESSYKLSSRKADGLREVINFYPGKIPKQYG